MESLLAAAVSTAVALAPVPASTATAQACAGTQSVAQALFSEHWTPPTGYSAADTALGAPVEAVFIKRLHEDEAALIVERYAAADPEAADPQSFLRNLAGKARKTSRRIGEKSYEVYADIELENFTRQIAGEDPYADALGRRPEPPRLSLFERRRFPAGGEAYRLYRCLELDAWKTLRRYRRLRAKGEDLYDFRTHELDSVRRRVINACFGPAILSAMANGEAAPDLPAPSMRRLRIMARDEWNYGASRRLERECVHLRPFQGGLYVLRLRAPRDDYAREMSAFDALLRDFSPPAPEPAKNP